MVDTGPREAEGGDAVGVEEGIEEKVVGGDGKTNHEEGHVEGAGQTQQHHQVGGHELGGRGDGRHQEEDQRHGQVSPQQDCVHVEGEQDGGHATCAVPPMPPGQHSLRRAVIVEHVDQVMVDRTGLAHQPRHQHLRLPTVESPGGNVNLALLLFVGSLSLSSLWQHVLMITLLITFLIIVFPICWKLMTKVTLKMSN